MKLFGFLLLIGMAVSVPTMSSPNRSTFYITENFFPERFKIYTSEHDIVNMMVPLNELNFVDKCKSMHEIAVLFFVQGDYKEDGTFDNKGLYLLNIKKREATKLLDNGVDFTFACGETKDVYFAATDGIYLYNAKKNTADKYGSVTDNIINIAKANNKDVIYALTANKELYRVTENGKKKVRVDDVKNAQQIVLDDQENLYFYDSEKHIFVFSENKVKRIDGFPENPNKITLIKPIQSEKPITIIIDDKLFVYVNGRAVREPMELRVNLTALAGEAVLFLYYAYNKSIYEYNIQMMRDNKDYFPEVTNYLNDEKDHFESVKRSITLNQASKALK